MQRDQFAAAADLFEAAAQHDPSFVSVSHGCRGAAFLQRGKPAEAIGEFEKALAAQPDYLLAHMGLGVALLKVGRADEAVGEFRAAQKLNPDDATIKRNLSTALEEASTQPSTSNDGVSGTAGVR
jgi:protein O-GlcNAc transferase